MTPIEEALWANEIQRACLLEAGDDIDAGLAAAEYILATQPIPLSTDSGGRKHKDKGVGEGQFTKKGNNTSDNLKEVISGSGVVGGHGDEEALANTYATLITDPEWIEKHYPELAAIVRDRANALGLPIPDSKPLSINAFFAHDISNKRAQGILNDALKAAKGLSASARKDLTSAIDKDSGGAILEFIEKYRLDLARLLTHTQLAAVLTGAREIAAKIPTLDAGVKAVKQIVGDIPQPKFPTSDGPSYTIIQEAAKSLAEKNVLTRPQYDALESAARAKALVVAGVDATETLTKIRDTLAENVRNGADYPTFKQKILSAVDKGTFLSDAHNETVFRTNVQTAFSDGQMTVLSNPLVRAGFPYSAYDSIHDDRVRDHHLALDTAGISKTNIYRSDDPVFQTFRPPWDYNCRCSWTPITIRQAAEKGISEAQEWLETGIEPSPPAFVIMPNFAPPDGFQRSLNAAPLAIQLSMQPMGMFENTITKPCAECTEDTYPRDNANRFLDKYDIADATQNDTKATSLRESIPETEHGKLDRLLYILQEGGAIHHPKEPSGMAINKYGDIVNWRWSEYSYRSRSRERWEDRESNRNECRDHARKAIRFLRKESIDLDEIDELIECAGATEPELRALSRVRHRITSRDGDTTELEDAYEDIIERIHKRIDEEAKADIEPEIPTEPTDMTSGAAFRIADESQGHWVTIGGHAEGEKKHVDGFRVFISDNGTILKGRAQGAKVTDVKEHFDAKRGESGNATRKQRTAKPTQPEPTEDTGIGGAGQSGTGVASDSGSVEDTSSGPSDTGASQNGADSNQPVDTRDVKRIAANDAEVNRRLERFEKLFRARGREQLANWMTALREHVAAVGAESALESLGEEVVDENEERHDVQYSAPDRREVVSWGDGTDRDVKFINAYLARSGIIPLPIYGTTAKKNTPLVTPFTEDPRFRHRTGDNETPGDFKPKIAPFKNKLEESQHLPGLESTEDLDKATNERVTHLTPQVMAKLDKKFGKGKWIIKNYDADTAFAGAGIYFPQFAKKIREDARSNIATGKNILANNGLSYLTNDEGKIIGIQDDKRGYKFGSSSYKQRLGTGELRTWGDAIAESVNSMDGAELPNKGKKFMVQPAFNAVGATEESRAAGTTWQGMKEGRVHVVVRNGKAEIVPHSTWIKGEYLPVVFENNDSREMQKAAQNAIDQLPEKAKNGQVYAPDIIRTDEGFKVVELNYSEGKGSSGFLQFSPFTIDAFTSHMTGREPEHVRFIRRLLTQRQKEAAALALALSIALSTDTSGRQHKEKGKGGGQFTSKGRDATDSNAVKKTRAGQRKAATDIVRQTMKELTEEVLTAAIAAGNRAGAAEHFAAHWIADRIEKLPTALRLPLKALYYMGFAAFLAGQKAAKEVAREVGGDKHADKVSATCATIDNIAAVAAKAAALGGAHGPQELALLIPVASVSYLAYATARHPVATFNAAGKGVKAALAKLKGKKKDDRETDTVSE